MCVCEISKLSKGFVDENFDEYMYLSHMLAVNAQTNLVMSASGCSDKK